MKQVFLSILLMLVPVVVNADGVEIDGIYYHLDANSKTAEVASNPYKSGEVVIQETLEYGEVTYSVTSIGNWAFAECRGLTSITIPNGVTSIGEGAFYHCIGLTSITIPNSVTSIGVQTFFGCSGLTSVIIPNSVIFIGSNAFYGTALYNNHPDGVVYVDNFAVAYKGELPDNRIIKIAEGTIGIAVNTFYGLSGLSSVTIPNSVISIDDYAFFKCSGLASVTIPNSVTFIGDAAFASCSGLTSAIIPSRLTSIGRSTFSGCSGLTSITIPYSVTSIGDYAFADCSGLTSITISNKVTSIGDYAFFGCTSIQFVKSFITEPYSISKDVFPDEVYRQGTLYIPAGTEKLYTRFDGWREFLKIEEMDGSEEQEIPGAEKCAMPTIIYENGKLSFSCETEGVEYKYKIEAKDAKEGYGNDIQMTKTYRVSVYAFKDGMNNSDPAIADILVTGGIKGDSNGDDVVNAADIVEIVNIIMGK